MEGRGAHALANPGTIVMLVSARDMISHSTRLAGGGWAAAGGWAPARPAHACSCQHGALTSQCCRTHSSKRGWLGCGGHALHAGLGRECSLQRVAPTARAAARTPRPAVWSVTLLPEHIFKDGCFLCICTCMRSRAYNSALSTGFDQYWLSCASRPGPVQLQL